MKQKLFNYFADEHSLVLTDSELNEVYEVVKQNFKKDLLTELYEEFSQKLWSYMWKKYPDAMTNSLVSPSFDIDTDLEKVIVLYDEYGEHKSKTFDISEIWN